MLSRRTTVYPCSLIKLSISFNNRSLSGIRSCRRMIEPGRNLFWIRFKTFSLEGCSVSSVLIFQPTGVYPNMRTAFAIVGFVTPNGGRNNLIFCEVTRSNANWQACKSFFIRDRLYKGKWLVWVKEYRTDCSIGRCSSTGTWWTRAMVRWSRKQICDRTSGTSDQPFEKTSWTSDSGSSITV